MCAACPTGTEPSIRTQLGHRAGTKFRAFYKLGSVPKGTLGSWEKLLQWKCVHDSVIQQRLNPFGPVSGFPRGCRIQRWRDNHTGPADAWSVLHSALLREVNQVLHSSGLVQGGAAASSC